MMSHNSGSDFPASFRANSARREPRYVRREESQAADGVPVYSLEPAGAPAVPTGRVFVRLATDDLPPGIAGAGYRVESRPGYAPEAAWLVAEDGEIASALGCLEALAAVDGVVAVEPEMLRPVSRRGRL